MVLIMIPERPEQGSYRTSEIATAALEQLEAEEYARMDASQVQPQIESAVEMPAPIYSDVPDAAVLADMELGQVRTKLAQLASQAAMAGRVKAAYLIERTLQELS